MQSGVDLQENPMTRLSRLTATIAAPLLLMPLLSACSTDPIASAGSYAAPTAVNICATARAGITAAPGKAQVAAMQCLVAAETAYQSAALLALPFVSNGTIKGKAIDRLREINTEVVRQLGEAYDATTAEHRLDLADAIGAATAEIFRIIAVRDATVAPSGAGGDEQ
jgi:hypothetical protein